jgi:hypothetical protein
MASPREQNPVVTRLLAESRFVFTGTVERESSSSLSFVPGGANSAVVRVERVHHGASILQQQTGQQVTVLFAATRSSEFQIQRRVFFTNPVLYGETIAVRAVGEIDVPADLDALHESVVAMTERVRVEELHQHLLSADAVVHARVVSRRPADPGAIPSSEHDPLWWVAMLRIINSIKGNQKGEVPVRYPSSRDIAWFGVPKPKEDQEGIFLLHRDGLELGGAVFAILHHGDLLPATEAELQRIADLLRARPSRANREASDV